MAESFFDKVAALVPEQETIICPFCSSGYVSEKEHRPLIDCPACEGYAFIAKRAEQEIAALYPLLETLPLYKIEQMIRKLGPGYDRSEFRTCWRERQQEAKE